MEHLLMAAGGVSVLVLGVAFVFCAIALIATKAVGLSIKKMPWTRQFVLIASAIAATCAAQKGGIPDQPDDPPVNPPDNPSPKLVFWSTFDSLAAVTNPAVGAAGSCAANATFASGKEGSALQVPANSNSSVARLPLPDGLPATRGCIEFWAKIDGGSTTYSGGGGSPDFLLARTADNDSTFISLAFTANDGAGRGGLCCGYGFYGLEMFSEAVAFAKPYSDYLTQDTVFDWHHYALVWNVDGITSLSGSPRAAIILDGTMRVCTNGSEGWNRADFLVAMSKSAYLSFGHAGSHVTYLIDELKVWDGDKTTFNDEPEVPPDDTPPNLIFYSTLDSQDAITSPVVGNAGTCNGSTFIDGQSGNALSVPVRTDLVDFPFPDGLSANKGCIEFWAKLNGSNTTYTDSGNPTFLHANSSDGSLLFAIEFNANNGGGRGGILSLGMLGFAPEGWSYSKPYSTYLTGSISDWYHYAIVWNINGIATINGAPYAAILINGNVVARLNANEGWSKDAFVRAMSGSLHVFVGGGASKVPFAIDDLKIWDGDKTTFTFTKFAYHSDVTAVYDGQEHTLHPPAGLAGDEVFRYSLDRNGPFAETLPSLTDAGTMRIWYEETIGEEKMVSSAVVTIQKRPLTFTSASATKTYDGTPLTTNEVTMTGMPPLGEGFTFSVTGSQTYYGESENTFTWSPNGQTNPDNYAITTVCGTLNVTLSQTEAADGYEVIDDGAGNRTMRITRLDYPDGGDVTLPTALGGLPVSEIAVGALAGSGVTGVHVPSGVAVAGALFENLPQATNFTFEAGCTVVGALSFRGDSALQEIVVPDLATALAPWAFLGCWNLERVVFSGEPPFGNAEADGTDTAALLTASVRPASLLQMADMICYPADCAARWEKSLRNLGYGGKYGAYEGAWTGAGALVADSGNLNPPVTPPVTNVIVSVVTNVIPPVTNVISSVTTNMIYSYSVITNVIVPATPADQPAARYAAQAGAASGMVLAGSAGWDAFGLPDGMTWDKATGTLGGVPTRSGLYDVMLVSGSGAETKLMRTTVEVASYAAVTGYVGVAFSATGAPWDILASYSKLPSGLSWKNKVLSGVPKKSGSYSFETTDGEPVELVIQELPAGLVGVYNGILVGETGERFPLKVSTTSAGKLSATVTQGTKNYSLSVAQWSAVAVENVDGSPHRMFTATLASGTYLLAVKVDADAAWNSDQLTAVGLQGALSGLAGSAQQERYATDGSARDVAAALSGTYALTAEADGTNGWTLKPAGTSAKGQFNVVLKPTGVATISGTPPNGKSKINASATLHVDANGVGSLMFYVKGTWFVWSASN